MNDETVNIEAVMLDGHTYTLDSDAPFYADGVDFCAKYPNGIYKDPNTGRITLCISGANLVNDAQSGGGKITEPGEQGYQGPGSAPTEWNGYTTSQPVPVQNFPPITATPNQTLPPTPPPLVQAPAHPDNTAWGALLIGLMYFLTR